MNFLKKKLTVGGLFGLIGLIGVAIIAMIGYAFGVHKWLWNKIKEWLKKLLDK